MIMNNEIKTFYLNVYLDENFKFKFTGATLYDSALEAIGSGGKAINNGEQFTTIAVEVPINRTLKNLVQKDQEGELTVLLQSTNPE
jgi:hypothetical protein